MIKIYCQVPIFSLTPLKLKIKQYQLKHPLQVTRWPSNFAPSMKTKLKDFSGEI